MDPSALSTLLGYWSHVLLFRRDGFSVLQDAYPFARLSARGPGALPQSVRSKLLLLACLIPVLSTDLRAPVSSTIVATDATVTRGFCATAHRSPAFRWR